MTNGLFPPVKRDRRSRIKKLEKVIKAASDKPKAIATFCLDEGVSLRKVREYLKILKLAGKVDEDVKI